jgi:phosphinothricin acetyltransferase
MKEVAEGTSADLWAIVSIYEHYVAASAHTFDLEPPTEAWWTDWFSTFQADTPLRLVVAREDEGVVGYAYTGPYGKRGAYATSVTASVYVAPGERGRGLGSALYDQLLPPLEAADVHRAYAAIALPNAASIALHERFGFVKVGHFSEQGYKFGRYWDVAWYERPC